MSWRFEKHKSGAKKLNNPILVEGLPGLGNVGKIAADFIVDKLGAKRIMTISSYTFPHSVFVNEKNLVELPKIELYGHSFNKKGKNDLLILVGDVQPIDEKSCYEFCEKLISILLEYHGKEIITLGGIGLSEVKETPKVYCTGNDAQIISRYVKGTHMSDKVYGVVGPIVGVSGLLLGLAEKRKVPAVCLLAETVGHPMYLGIKGAREVLKVLNKRLGLGLMLKSLDKEIAQIENEVLKKTKELSQLSKETAIRKIEGKFGSDVTYIG